MSYGVACTLSSRCKRRRLRCRGYALRTKRSFPPKVFDDVLTEVLRLHPPFFQLVGGAVGIGGGFAGEMGEGPSKPNPPSFVLIANWPGIEKFMVLSSQIAGEHIHSFASSSQ